MSKNIFNLFKIKDRGEIKIGFLANIFVYDLQENICDDFHGFTDYSLYRNMSRQGRVIHTINRGKFVIKNMEFHYSEGIKI